MNSLKKMFPLTIRDSILKMNQLLFATGLGVFCGLSESYRVFFFIVMILSINNMYDSFMLLEGYNSFVTLFQTAIFMSSGLNVLIALGFFMTEPVEVGSCVYPVTAILGLPILFYLIEAVRRLCSEE